MLQRGWWTKGTAVGVHGRSGRNRAAEHGRTKTKHSSGKFVSWEKKRAAFRVKESKASARSETTAAAGEKREEKPVEDTDCVANRGQTFAWKFQRSAMPSKPEQKKTVKPISRERDFNDDLIRVDLPLRVDPSHFRVVPSNLQPGEAAPVLQQPALERYHLKQQQQQQQIAAVMIEQS